MLGVPLLVIESIIPVIWLKKIKNSFILLKKKYYNQVSCEAFSLNDKIIFLSVK